MNRLRNIDKNDVEFWYECRDLNPGSSAGLESIIPNTAATIRQALQDGDEEVAFALLDLLTALGGQPI